MPPAVISAKILGVTIADRALRAFAKVATNREACVLLLGFVDNALAEYHGTDATTVLAEAREDIARAKRAQVEMKAAAAAKERV